MVEGGHTVIRGAQVLDGNGGEPFTADVLIEGGLIAAVEEGYSGEVDRTLDADGQYLAPGFIDAHCHDDLELLRNPDRPEKIAQGATCVVVGNCGLSLYPCDEASRAHVRDHAAGLLGPLEESGVFEDFHGYRAAVERHGVALHYVSLVGHGPLRLTVVGHSDRPASAEERSRMEALLRLQLREGAAGLSLGLVYPPSAYAKLDELAGLCRVANEEGKLVAAHIRSYEAGLCAAVHEFVDLLRESGAKGILSHLQAAGRPNWGRVSEALAILDSANAEGIDIAFDMYPYLAGSSYALQLIPLDVWSDGVEELKKRISNPRFRTELSARLESGRPESSGWQSKVGMIGWESVLIAGVVSPGLKKFEGLTIAQAGIAFGMTPFDVLTRLIRYDDGATAIVLFQLSERDLKAAFTHRLHMVGSDGIPRASGRPHPRTFGAMPRVINTVAKTDHWLSLGEAVRRMTSAPAERFGLVRRGRIELGYFADLVLFEQGFRDEATFEDPRRLAHGARYVWVEGVPVLAEGKPTANRPGHGLG